MGHRSLLDPRQLIMHDAVTDRPQRHAKKGAYMLKSHSCGELRKFHDQQEVTLAGWVAGRRDHGGLIFLDLWDRFGTTQITVDAERDAVAHAEATKIRTEYVVQVLGTVQDRPAGRENPELATGEIEVAASAVRILNASLTPPFYIRENTDDTDEALRLKYRYLDLRRPPMMRNLLRRHELVRFMRDFLSDRQFVEVETPYLLKSTPEGARDFVVPSRLQRGLFYALLQSPQQLKQLLMVAGLERYFQIARCFRDEDFRANRQPEFSQLDLEMSFVDQQDIQHLFEDLLIEMTRIHSQKQIKEIPFPVLTYRECMERYGSDRPDLRFDLELFDVTAVLAACEFQVFRRAIAQGGQVKGILYPNGCHLSRKALDSLTEVVRSAGAQGLAWIGLHTAITGVEDIDAQAIRSQIARFLTPAELADVIAGSGAQQGDMILLVADQPATVAASLNLLRSEVAHRASLIDPHLFAFCWVTEFPLLERDQDTGHWTAVHHPFSSAMDEDWELLATDPGAVRAKAYDVVLNGWELAGGSIRIHDRAKQMALFHQLNLSAAEIQSEFGHLLEAFQYGAPPHGGIAMGLDRLAALFADTANIRDVMAFPKSSGGSDLMVEAPSKLEDEKLMELGLEVIAEP